MAKLLPNGKQVFLDNDGNPLVAGTVDMYIPSTTTRKDTWQDAEETTLNANPIVLDGYGRATILGNGLYRQVVKDSDGATIWDKVVAVYSPQAVLWGGVSTGSANNQSIALQNGDLETESSLPIGGQVIAFTAGYTNTSAAQITVTWPGPSTNGPVQLSKSSYLGPAPLEGGEIVVGNMLFMIYDDDSGQWFVINPVSVGTVYVPACFSVDSPLPSHLCSLVLLREYTLAEDAPGSYAYAETAPAEDYEISLQQNGIEFGTVLFTSAGNVGTITVNAEVSFSATDRFIALFPADVDSNIGGIGMSFKLSRSFNG